MIHIFPGFILGIVTLILFAVNTIFCGSTLYIFIFLKIIIPVARWRALCSHVFVKIAECWIDVNSLIMRLIQRTEWDVQNIEGIRYDGSYLIIANHRSWLDIPLLQKVFNRRIPLLRFFLKRELIKVPILGLAWWALDFPFMRRYTKEELERRPELKGEDQKAVRAACAKYRSIPVSILNFLEGTRFTPFKKERQKSPYRHLLLPKAGGIAGVIAEMGLHLQGILNLTIIYSDPKVTLWDFVCGRLDRIIVRGEFIPIPIEFLSGDYTEDLVFREKFQDWVNRLWEEKDALIEKTVIFTADRKQHQSNVLK
jgi:1-acyl-sn-glycerol-3-phosphate acyltransferase